MRRRLSPLLASALLAFLALGACVASTFPTGDEIEEALEQSLRSVAGDWSGTTSGGGLRLGFRLTEGAGGQLTGTGTMREGTAASVPLTVTGTFQRPDLSLVFEGMVYEGRSVRGTFSGRYTNVGGISEELVLTGTGYSKRLPVVLSETALVP